MFKKIGLFITNVVRSLDNVQGQGYSARKLSSLFAILMGAYVTKYKLRPEDQLMALYAWLALALLCLGIVTVQNIIDFKNGKQNAPTPDGNTNV